MSSDLYGQLGTHQQPPVTVMQKSMKNTPSSTIH